MGERKGIIMSCRHPKTLGSFSWITLTRLPTFLLCCAKHNWCQQKNDFSLSLSLPHTHTDTHILNSISHTHTTTHTPFLSHFTGSVRLNRLFAHLKDEFKYTRWFNCYLLLPKINFGMEPFSIASKCFLSWFTSQIIILLRKTLREKNLPDI